MDAQIDVALSSHGWSRACGEIDENRVITKDWMNHQIRAYVFEPKEEEAQGEKKNVLSLSRSAREILLSAVRKYMTLVFKHVGADVAVHLVNYNPKQILETLLAAEAQAEAQAEAPMDISEDEAHESD